jgi:predicted transcriptional regulator
LARRTQIIMKIAILDFLRSNRKPLGSSVTDVLYGTRINVARLKSLGLQLENQGLLECKTIPYIAHHGARRLSRHPIVSKRKSRRAYRILAKGLELLKSWDIVMSFLEKPQANATVIATVTEHLEVQ